MRNWAWFKSRQRLNFIEVVYFYIIIIIIIIIIISIIIIIIIIIITIIIITIINLFSIYRSGSIEGKPGRFRNRTVQFDLDASGSPSDSNNSNLSHGTNATSSSDGGVDFSDCPVDFYNASMIASMGSFCVTKETTYPYRYDMFMYYVKKKERERHLPVAFSWWRPQCRLKATHFIHFHRDLLIPAMSTVSSQVGVALFPSF